MEKANILTLIFIRADFAICSCPHRQRGAGGGTGEPGKVLSSGEAGPGQPRPARSGAGQGGTSRHPVPTRTPLGKRAAPRYSLGKAVPRHPGAADADGIVMLRAWAAGWHVTNRQPVSRLGRGGNGGHPRALAGLAWTPFCSPPAKKPRARGAGSVGEARADSPAISQRKENTTRRRINSSARGRASKQPLPNGTAPFPGQAWPHHGAGQQHWVPGQAVTPPAVPPWEMAVWTKSA